MPELIRSGFPKEFVKLTFEQSKKLTWDSEQIGESMKHGMEIDENGSKFKFDQLWFSA